MTSPEDVLDTLMADAESCCRQGESTEHFEPALSKLVAYLQANPDIRALAESRFVPGITTASLCWELVAFCMHILRFERVRTEVEQLLRHRPNPRSMGYLSNILRSFDDDWEDRELFARFRNELS